MDFSQVKEILALVNQSELKEFDLQMDNVVLHMSKNNGIAGTAVHPTATSKEDTVVMSSEQSHVQQSFTGPQSSETISSSVVREEQTHSDEGTVVRAPIVGVVYLAASPDQPAYKKVGDKVTVGETICIVEAMKLMNEIKSDAEGTIAEILVEDEQVVEYNQPLFRIV